jgi:hypothetical protein
MGGHVLRSLFIAATFAAAVLCTGCASIVSGHNQSVSVKTTSDGNDVSGAQCELTNDKGSWYTTTPGSVTVRRSYNELVVTCKLAGMTPGTDRVKSSTKGMAFGNVIFGGVIGAGIDVASGAAYDYPTLINIAMPSGAAGAPVASATKVPAPVAVPAAAPIAVASAQPAAAPGSASFQPGTTLIVRENDAMSSAVLGETVLVVFEQSASNWAFNQGTIVARSDGTPVKGQMHDALIYGIGPAELSRGVGTVEGKFRGLGGADTVPVTLTMQGKQQRVVAGQPFDAVRVRVEGYAMRSASANGSGSTSGASIEGEMWVDARTGLVLSTTVKSRHPAYNIQREVVRIDRPGVPA